MEQVVFQTLNAQIFDNQLPQLPIVWRHTKNVSTAGAYSHKDRHIRLYSRVVNTPKKMQDTLAHEMIHAYLCIVKGKLTEHHGPTFRK